MCRFIYIHNGAPGRCEFSCCCHTFSRAAKHDIIYIYIIVKYYKYIVIGFYFYCMPSYIVCIYLAKHIMCVIVRVRHA